MAKKQPEEVAELIVDSLKKKISEDEYNDFGKEMQMYFMQDVAKLIADACVKGMKKEDLLNTLKKNPHFMTSVKSARPYSEALMEELGGIPRSPKV